MVRNSRYYVLRKWKFMMNNMRMALRHIGWLEQAFQTRYERYTLHRLAILITKLMIKLTAKTIIKMCKIF